LSSPNQTPNRRLIAMSADKVSFVIRMNENIAKRLRQTIVSLDRYIT
jgi:hypothetical protein